MIAPQSPTQVTHTQFNHHQAHDSRLYSILTLLPSTETVALPKGHSLRLQSVKVALSPAEILDSIEIQ